MPDEIDLTDEELADASENVMRVAAEEEERQHVKDKERPDQHG